MRSQLLELDARLTYQMRIAEKPGALRSLAAVFAHSGDSWFWALGLAILWLLAGPYWKSRAVILFAGMLLTAAVVLTIKFTVRRRRPEGDWGAIYRSTDPHSFPSGHAARAVMLAVLALGLGPAWFAGVMLAWAPLVALARVAMGLHYLSDVIAGAVLGIGMGTVILQIV